ncbi:hypothetical protein BJ170DRAFT_9915 [Xylariales sp. AK1849]|nr:hypothetical protein BJ170DRAFT_9915 [Xylariales sp. AK1849]
MEDPRPACHQCGEALEIDGICLQCPEMWPAARSKPRYFYYPPPPEQHPGAVHGHAGNLPTTADPFVRSNTPTPVSRGKAHGKQSGLHGAYDPVMRTNPPKSSFSGFFGCDEPATIQQRAASSSSTYESLPTTLQVMFPSLKLIEENHLGLARVMYDVRDRLQCWEQEHNEAYAKLHEDMHLVDLHALENENARLFEETKELREINDRLSQDFGFKVVDFEKLTDQHANIQLLNDKLQEEYGQLGLELRRAQEDFLIKEREHTRESAELKAEMRGLEEKCEFATLKDERGGLLAEMRHLEGAMCELMAILSSAQHREGGNVSPVQVEGAAEG